MQVYRPRVFISYSGTEAKKFRDHLVARLEENGQFEVLLDEKAVQPGEPWRAVIDEWIWHCDAAVLLLSEAATLSDYVKYEATHLRQRWKSHSDSFIFLPVRFPEVTEESLVRRMGPIQLNEIQQIVVTESTADTDQEVVQRILARLAPLIDRKAARHEFEQDLIDTFYYRCLSDEALQDLGDELGVHRIAAGAKKDRSIVVARALLEFGTELGELR